MTSSGFTGTTQKRRIRVDFSSFPRLLRHGTRIRSETRQSTQGIIMRSSVAFIILLREISQIYDKLERGSCINENEPIHSSQLFETSLVPRSCSSSPSLFSHVIFKSSKCCRNGRDQSYWKICQTQQMTWKSFPKIHSRNAFTVVRPCWVPK